MGRCWNLPEKDEWGNKMKKCLMCALLICVLMGTAGYAAGEIRLQVSAEEVRTGEIVDIRVETETDAVVYELRREDTSVFSGKEDTHLEASFRPREAGTYRLTVHSAKNPEDSASAEIRVTGTAEEAWAEDGVYSQKDGWWKNRPYGKSELEKAGCAIFTLSHALQRMGFSGEDVLPQNLAVTYKGCYTEGGTANARLLTRASEVYGYTTDRDLIKNAKTIQSGLKRGDMFSFGIVIGHIALVSGLDEKGEKARIADSAPGATFERIKKGNVYYQQDGSWKIAEGPQDLPGIRYYFETGTWGGAEYYMDLSYVARRGARLIRPGWLFMRTETGRVSVTPVHMGTALSTVTAGKDSLEVPTRDLSWTAEGTASQLAFVSGKKAVRLLDEDGKKIGTLAAGSLTPILQAEEKRLLVMAGETRGYLKRSDAQVLDVVEEYRTGVIQVNGYTNGRMEVKVRFAPSAKGKVMAQWKTGTRVAVLAEQDGFFLVEAKGLRVWVQAEYVLTDEKESTPEET